MAHFQLIIDILVRLSIVLLIGWLALRLTVKLNPRWSTLITRLMISASVCLPVIYLFLPTTNIQLLPSSQPPKPIKTTSQAIPEINLEKSVLQSSQQRSNEVNEIHTVAPDSRSRGNDVGAADFTAVPPELMIEDNAVLVSNSEIKRTDERQTVADVAKVTQVNQSNSKELVLKWLSFVWICMSSLLLFRICVQMKRAQHLLRNSHAATISVQQECEVLATKLGLSRIPQVHVSSEINGPCMAGFVSPTVFIPEAWNETLSEQERRAVLMHEISHIAGRDSLWDLFAKIVTAIWWFHPLMWRLSIRHRLACEHTSDALAANAINGIAEYRRLLAQWTLRRQGVESNSAVLAMADRSCMLRRLQWLEVPRPCGTIGRSRRFLFILVSAIFMIGFANFKLIPKAIAQRQVVVNNSDDAVEAKRPDLAESKSSNQKMSNRKPNVADIDTSQTYPKIIHVVDEHDKPIEGARVRVGWWEDEEGDMLILLSLNPPVTNQQGEVTIQVPKGASRAQISAEATGYAKAGTQYSLNGEPTLKLKPGRIIHVQAIDTKGNLLPDAYPLLEDSHILGREFKQDKNRIGYFTSPVVKLNRRWMRVVDGSGDGPILFSDLIDVTNPENVSQDGTIIATLHSGIRLEGRLDASVPRPILNGCVELYIAEAEGHRIGKGWVWQDTAFVNEDGSFAFDSLPAGGTVQLFALVDGYQSTKPTVQSLKDYLEIHDAGKPSLLTNAIERQDAFWPHLFALPEGQYKVEVELPCTETSSLDVVVVDPIGQPIEDAHVKFSPNGLFFGGKLFIPTTEIYTNAAQIRSKDQSQWSRLSNWAASTFLDASTNVSGIAHVRNLPSNDRESYRVNADGYIMPIYPTSSVQEPARYAAINLIGGETQRRTITMEKYVPSSSREILVVNPQAKPIPDIKVTVSEIAFKETPDDWELWASQRFGPVAVGTTGQDGMVRLQVPLEVNQKPVSRLRIVIQGRVGKNAAVHQNIAIPRNADGRVVLLTESDKPLKHNYSLQTVDAAYLNPKTLLSDSPKVLLKQLVASPSLIVLNQLLSYAGFDAATPLSFRSDDNILRINNPKKLKRSPIVSIPTDRGDRVIVLCAVRPKDAAWDFKPQGRFPPGAAFVFDPEDGSLIRMIGGWASSQGSYNNVMLTNQGGTNDYFIATSAFEKHSPFEYIQRWYRVGHEMQPALTFYNYANGMSWYGKNGPSKPIAELGYIQFRFNGRSIDHKLGGVLADGAIVPRRIYWDGAHKQFIGPVTQSFDGKPLYRVVTAESAEFTPLEVKPGEIVIAGGRRQYQNWHWWDVVIPAGKTGQLQLFLLDQTGAKPVKSELNKHTLSSGKHLLQLKFGNDQQNDQLSSVELLIDSESVKQIEIPRVPISNAPSVKDKMVARTASSIADLLNLETSKKKVSFVWQIKLE